MISITFAFCFTAKVAYCGGVLSIVVTDTGKIFCTAERDEEANVCQTDATSCHETENGGSKRRFGYICPGLKNMVYGSSNYRKENL